MLYVYMVIKKSNNVISRRIHGSIFLIDITDNYMGNKCALYEINETGLFVWENIDGIHNVAEIAKSLKAAIQDDVDYEVIYDDVLSFVDTLISKCFVES